MALKTTSKIIEPYVAIAVQGNWEKYNPNIRGQLEGEKFKERNLQRMCDYIDSCFNVGGHPLPVKLICFPEFCFGGIYNLRTTPEEVQKYEAVAIPGPETNILAEKARKYNIYIMAANHENDPAIPESHFNTAFIINPEGKIILKYRKLNIAYGCNPHDIFDSYTNPITGTRDFFPVVDTKIGRLACFIGGDIMIPEIPRMLAMKGAEVICHPTSGSLELSRLILRVRALDNTAYILDCNWAFVVLTTERLGDTWSGTAYDSRGGGQSIILDYNGNILAQADDKTPQIVAGAIDILAIRKARTEYKNPVMGTGDSIAACRTELYAPFYNKTIFPPNKVLVEGYMKYAFDASVNKRRAEAVVNRQKLYDFYSEDDVK